MKTTRAVHHIPLASSNPGKLARLDALAAVYLALVQQYVRSLSRARAGQASRRSWGGVTWPGKCSNGCP